MLRKNLMQVLDPAYSHPDKDQTSGNTQKLVFKDEFMILLTHACRQRN